MTDSIFQPRLYASCMLTFIPWPAFGEWVWTASPARKTRPCMPYLLPNFWPICKTLWSVKHLSTATWHATHLIYCPPLAVLVADLVRLQDVLCSFEYHCLAALPSIEPFTLLRSDTGKLDIQAHKSALTWYHHDRTIGRTVYDAAHSNLG